MQNTRIKRIGEEIRKVVSQMLTLGEIKDPRIPSLVSVTQVDVTGDLKYAYIYVSILTGDKQAALEGLKHASSFVRKNVGREVKLRYTPEMIFKLDESIERGIYMSNLIDKVIKKDGK